MSNYKQRITATFLFNCSPDKAYEWLAENWQSPEKGKLSFWEHSELERERKFLEYLLLKRRNALIDLGLAKYGWSPQVLKRIFAHGGKGVRCAILSSPALFNSSLLGDTPIVDLHSIVKRGNRFELEALSLNPHLSDEYYEHLIQRTEYFSGLTERDYKFMLCRMGQNKRLCTPLDDIAWDGYSDYKYHRVFTAVWSLASTVQVTQEWALVLVHLLQNACPPVGYEGIEETIERWRIDSPKEEGERYYNLGYGFELRSRLADLLEADDNLLDSSDLALRKSFYRRFRPWKYKEWAGFLDKDGEEFIREAIQSNYDLWKSQEEREKLSRLAWDCPDPNSDMMMPSLFETCERRFREEHPKWFQEEDDEYSSEPDAIARRMEKLINSDNSRLENIESIIAKSSSSKWWGK